MPTTRRKVVHERRPRVSQEALSAFLEEDEDRLRNALRLLPCDFTPLPNSRSGYCIDPDFRHNPFQANTLYPEALALYDLLEEAASEYRKQQRAAARAAKPAAKTTATKRKTKA